MGNTKIPFSTEAKYLGITLDNKLSWTPHINDKIAKTKKIMVNINNIIKDHWAPQPRILRWAYTAFARPVLTYGALIWGHRAQSRSIQTKLRTINRLAVNACVSIPLSTPTKALELIMDLPPLHLYIENIALNSLYRLQDSLDFLENAKDHNSLLYPNNPHDTLYKTPHLQYWVKQSNKIYIPDLSSSRCYYHPVVSTYSIDTDSLNTVNHQPRNNIIQAYTDGSKTMDGVGAGLCLMKNNTVLYTYAAKLPEHATVFQAELYAIQAAATEIARRFQNTEIDIYTDSQSALQALKPNIIRDRSVKNTTDKLLEAASNGNAIQLKWIKAHSGFDGNEIADSLAKRGTKLDHITDNNIPFAQCEVKRTLKEFTNSNWKAEWRDYTEARHSKIFYSQPDQNLARTIYTLSRDKIGKLSRIITDHNSFLYFRHIVDPENNEPFCRFCHESRFERAYHILLECPKFTIPRRDIFLDNLPENTQQ